MIKLSNRIRSTRHVQNDIFECFGYSRQHAIVFRNVKTAKKVIEINKVTKEKRKRKNEIENKYENVRVMKIKIHKEREKRETKKSKLFVISVNVWRSSLRSTLHDKRIINFMCFFCSFSYCLFPSISISKDLFGCEWRTAFPVFYFLVFLCYFFLYIVETKLLLSNVSMRQDATNTKGIGHTFFHYYFQFSTFSTLAPPHRYR